MTGALNFVQTAVWGILTFSILVVLHEMGHFLAARAFGVKVHEFMLGLPGPALRLHTKNMDWGITAVPLGGYVRIAGMEPGAEDDLFGPTLAYIRDNGPVSTSQLAAALGIDTARAEAIALSLAEWKALREEKDGRFSLTVDGDVTGLTADELLDRARSVTYRGKSTIKRITILAMGVLTNLVVAILTFTLVLSIWGYLGTTTVDTVEEGSPAADAGIERGDVLVALDGEPLNRWDEFQMKMAESSPGEDVALTVARDGRELDLEMTLGDRDGHGFAGVAPEVVRPNVFESLRESLYYVWLVLKTIAALFNPSTFSGTVGTLTGPVGVSVMAEEAAAAGPFAYAGLIAMLSLSLGLMNLLPMPPLDGGKIVLEVVERVVGRPLSRAVTLGFSAAGALLLFTLIGYVMYQDIVRFVL